MRSSSGTDRKANRTPPERPFLEPCAELLQAGAVNVDGRMKANASSTRERFINSVAGFLGWCAAPPRKWCDVPAFDRDKEARNSRRRARRAVAELSPQLIAFARHGRAGSGQRGRLASMGCTLGGSHARRQVERELGPSRFFSYVQSRISGAPFTRACAFRSIRRKIVLASIDRCRCRRGRPRSCLRGPPAFHAQARRAHRDPTDEACSCSSLETGR